MSPTEDFDAQALLEAMKALLAAIPEEPIDPNLLKSSQRTALRRQIQETIDALTRVLTQLDPIRLPPHVLDPSDPDLVGRLIADTLLVQDRHALNNVSRFYGSGIYAIYYSGKFPAYKPVSGSDTPLYVGKADPATSTAMTPVEQGQRLWSRLNDHRKSLQAATNLELEDFDCRYLVVKSAWQGTAETYLIDRFLPVWNNEVGICYGFGKHGDDPATRANTRSPWDTLHPGRTWATKEGNLPYKLTPKQIQAQILEHYKKQRLLTKQA